MNWLARFELSRQSPSSTSLLLKSTCKCQHESVSRRRYSQLIAPPYVIPIFLDRCPNLALVGIDGVFAPNEPDVFG